MDEQTPHQAPRLPAAPSNRSALILAGLALLTVFLLACVVMTPLGKFGASSGDALTEDEVRDIVHEAVGTELAALPAGAAGAASSADVQALVDQAVGTQVALLRPTNTPIPPTPTVIPVGVAEEDDAFRGPADAPVVIVEFADFQCGYCGRWYKQTLPKILETYPEQVKYVYRDFPIFGEESLNAAMATECAEEQDAFWEYHNRLFDRLENSEQTPLTSETLVSYAGELDLDTSAFSECLTSQKYLNEVIADYQAAQQYGFGGTPGFIVNGVVYAIGAQPFEVFQQIIDAELARLGVS